MVHSIISNEDYCFFCGKPKTAVHHLLFGKHRKFADEDGLFVPICNECHTAGEVKGRIHDNPMGEKMSKMIGQEEWEKHYMEVNSCNNEWARMKFIERYGINYL